MDDCDAVGAGASSGSAMVGTDDVAPAASSCGAEPERLTESSSAASCASGGSGNGRFCEEVVADDGVLTAGEDEEGDGSGEGGSGRVERRAGGAGAAGRGARASDGAAGPATGGAAEDAAGAAGEGRGRPEPVRAGPPAEPAGADGSGLDMVLARTGSDGIGCA